MTDTPSGASFLITGGTGSFGSTMVRHLLRSGASTVNILSRDEAKQDEMRQSLGDSRARFFIGAVSSSLTRLLRPMSWAASTSSSLRTPKAYVPLSA